MSNKSNSKLTKLIKEGNSLLKKNNLRSALIKFKQAQKENPNNAGINRAITSINTKIKNVERSVGKTPLEKYISATPGTIAKLERDKKLLETELNKEEEKLRICRINVKNKIKEQKSLDKQIALIQDEKNSLMEELNVVKQLLNVQNNTIINNNEKLMDDIQNMIDESNKKEQKRINDYSGGGRRGKRSSRRGGGRKHQDWEKNEGYYGPIMDKNGKLDREEICRYCRPSEYAKGARKFCKLHHKVWNSKTNSCRKHKKSKKSKRMKK